MFFDTAQWGVIGDDSPGLLLGVVSNVVTVTPSRGASYRVCIRVPSGFFSFMRDVLKLSEEEAKQSPVTFFLEQGDQWYFGITYGKGRVGVDLWQYKDLPGWANKARCL